jgi:hypothetical protein
VCPLTQHTRKTNPFKKKTFGPMETKGLSTTSTIENPLL